MPVHPVTIINVKVDVGGRLVVALTWLLSVHAKRWLWPQDGLSRRLKCDDQQSAIRHKDECTAREQEASGCGRMAINSSSLGVGRLGWMQACHLGSAAGRLRLYMGPWSRVSTPAACLSHGSTLCWGTEMAAYRGKGEARPGNQLLCVFHNFFFVL